MGVTPHLVTYLACRRRRAASGHAAFVRSHHRCRRRSLPLGLALGAALAGFV